MRATSSIRSISRVTSSRRSGGHRHVEAVVRGLAWRSRARAGSPPGAARATGTPRIACTRASRKRDRLCAAAARQPTSIVPAATRRAAQLDHQPRRDRLGVHALLRLQAPSRSARRPRCAGRAPTRLRWMFGPFQVATSSSTRVVSGCTSERAPPISPAIDVGPSASSISDHLAVERARLPVERLHLLALARAAHRQRARRRRGRGRTRAAAGR